MVWLSTFDLIRKDNIVFLDQLFSYMAVASCEYKRIRFDVNYYYVTIVDAHSLALKPNVHTKDYNTFLLDSTIRVA